MSVTKKFFHDRFILFVLTVNIFLALLCLVTVIFRLGDTSGIYIKRYQPNLGIDSITPGGVADMLAFPIFSAVVTVAFTVFALKLYAIRRQMAWIFLSLATLLLVLSLMISYRLLSAH
jgi:hypothetical protein